MNQESRNVALGIAISAVVCGHVLRMIVDAGFMQEDKVGHLLLAIRYVCSAIGFPVLFFVLGLEMPRSIERRLGFVRLTVRNIVYPYLLWSVLQTLFQWGLAMHAGRPFTLHYLIRIAWHPVDQFWFLYALFVCHLLALLAIPSRSAAARDSGAHAAYLLSGALAAACAALAMATSWGLVTMSFLGIAFFMMGAIVARIEARGISERAQLAGMLVLAVAFIGAIGVGRHLGGYQNMYAWPANVAGVALVITVAQWLGAKHLAHAVAWLGYRWKCVFVLYMIAADLAWTVLLSAGVTRDIVHAILDTGTGIGLPLLLYSVAQRFKLARLAGFCAPPDAREPPRTPQRRVSV
jgi:hypothetical protein